MFDHIDYGSVLDSPIGPRVSGVAHGILLDLMTGAVPCLEAVFEERHLVGTDALTDWTRAQAARPEMVELAKAVAEVGLRHPKDNYRAMSVVQKAVRLKNVEMAARAANALIKGGHMVALWRRLRVIAVEDIGLGDPTVAAYVIWLSLQKALQKELGPVSAVVAVTYLCAAAKSRDIQDVAYWQDVVGVLPQMPMLIQQPGEVLVDYGADKDLTFRERAAAMRCLFPGKLHKLPWKKKPPAFRQQLYTALGMPPVFAAMIEWDLSTANDSLCMAAPICWALLSASAEIMVGPDLLDPGGEPALVGRVYASAYDKHTYLGKQASGIWFNKVPELQAFFAKHPKADPMAALGRSIFYVEGALLRPKLHYDGSTDLYWSILEEKLVRENGLPSLEAAGIELLQLTQKHLPRLNEIRRWLDEKS